MSQDGETKTRNVWSAVAIVATVFVIPVIILVFAIQGLDDAYTVRVKNESSRALQNVRVSANGREFDLEDLATGEAKELSETFKDALEIGVEASLGGGIRTRSEVFSRPLTGAREIVEVVFDAKQRWILRRR